MKKTTLLLLILAIGFNCKKDPPVVPPNGGPDTTSHNWTFRTDSLGEFGSYLRDVALLEDGTAWAVGAVFGVDTTGPFGQQAVGAMMWNGTMWIPRRVITQFTGSPTNVAPIRGVLALGPSNIWFAAGSVVHWNGTSYVGYPLRGTILSGNETVEKLWGTSSNLILGVGNEGTVVRWNGSTWSKLVSNTTVDLLDVWGGPDGSVVWACGYKDFVGTVLLKITGTTVEKVYDDLDTWFRIRQDSLSGVLTSVWTNSNDKLYVITPAGLYECPATTRGEARRIWFNDTYVPGFPNALRGQARNDAITVGDYHMISHYNGNTVKYFVDLRRIARLWSVSIKGNGMVAVGDDIEREKALVVGGRRN